MDFESKATTQTATVRKPLVLLRDTEALLRRPAIATLTPILPPKLSNTLQVASNLADESLEELAEISLETISDIELQPVRIRVGLSCVGFSALMILVLLLYSNTLHPEMNQIQQVHQYWYQYIWFVCLGVTGMFILGREAMRSQQFKVQKSLKP
ncbi:hypothetical protein [Nostoc sp. CMAA1605]|uniref:hypothetical protein n=1 Tax=Nostoc sp. CMAA1605 TaxID=2055159 RepID=UPI001F37570B|nr:hypothetical protein [Nostoc sp. CMAA1605]MCF4969662.1 hypothetical protein [Nostoc sp. CMAA1605]